MKRTITLFTITLLFSIGGYSQSACGKFKNGTFKVTDPKSKKVCIITRNDDKQTERMEESDETFDFEIKWLDDCTYTVTPTASAVAQNQKILDIGTMTVKITKAKDSSYTQRITVANNPKFRRIDEVFLVKQKEE
ncbi:hypothetical protein R1T16_08750 [Flavobacterium sp. DG1-102-2]|uniref:hypothetical protein n=1 Tax=Flavobacterium sp. DG1-102-2 TaxID=3081663 RepID=UPI0029494A43|nr:hypothetical protein [Flavobacterium sp. DG1-102-2]MDV6168510.1 hypothetical protein [Flavobacterium sp. DG1-102-2]